MFSQSDVLWFPMRVSYSSAPRLLRLKELLDERSDVLDTYVAMHYAKVGNQMKFTPVISNLIFVRATYTNLTDIKNTGEFLPLRFIMHPVMEENGWVHREAMYIKDALMNDFIRVTSEANDKVIFLDNLEFACRPGQRVQITQGAFAGVKGVIKRIQGNVCVVVPIENTIAAAITGLPRKYLCYLGES